MVPPAYALNQLQDVLMNTSLNMLQRLQRFWDSNNLKLFHRGKQQSTVILRPEG